MTFSLEGFGSILNIRDCLFTILMWARCSLGQKWEYYGWSVRNLIRVLKYNNVVTRLRIILWNNGGTESWVKSNSLGTEKCYSSIESNVSADLS